MMTNNPPAQDSWQAMMRRVQAFHDKHRLKQTGGEEMTYRIALMAEELGEISSCVTKGKSKEVLAEEAADLLILVMGTAIAQGRQRPRSIKAVPILIGPCSA